jgi:nitrous oxidase accessory protein NosD
MARRARSFATVLVALVALLTPAGAQAATRYVDDAGSADTGACTDPATPCATIQYAVDQAAAGDTIGIAAGTYATGAVIDKANLTVGGAGVGQTTVQTAQARVFDLRSNADGVTIRDLTVRGPYGGSGTPADESGIYVGPTAGVDVAGLTVRDVEVTRVRYAVDVRFPGSAVGWTLANVNAHINQYGARFWGETTGLTIADSHFDFNDFGIYAQHPGTTPRTPGVFQDVKIDDSTFDGNATKGIYLEQGADLDFDDITAVTPQGPTPRADVNPNNAIDVNVKYGAFAHVHIANSTFSGSTGAGVLIHGRNDAPLYNTVPGRLDDVVLEGVTVTDNVAGVQFSGATTNSRITGSRIVANVSGGVTSWTDTQTIDAEGNWWGCNEGPNTPGCSSTTGDVDADPWLVLTAAGSPQAIATDGGTSTITAGVATDSDGNPAAPGFDLPAIALATDLGVLANGVLTAGPTAGTAHVTAQLDNAQAAATVELMDPPANTAPPAVTGETVAGSVLRCALGNWTGTRLTHARRWTRDGADIAGAKGDTYTTVSDDAGHAIGCRVTATNSVGSSAQAGNEIGVTARASAPEPPTAPTERSTVTPFARPLLTLGGRAAVAAVRCRTATGCTITAPRRTYVRVGGKTYRARVHVRPALAPNQTTFARVELRKHARRALRHRGAGYVALPIHVTGAAESRIVVRVTPRRTP